jgi:hypothetical protein
MNTSTMQPPPKEHSKARSWLARLGWAGFLFFFIKGLVWVAIFLGAGKLFVG